MNNAKRNTHGHHTTAIDLPSLAFRCAACVGLALFLVSCSSLPPARRPNAISEISLQPVRYSMVFIIHGDGGYLYHDSLGRPHLADQEALAGAIRAAGQNQQAEVLIFHQRPRKHAWLFFPRHDGTFYYYRNGRLLAKEAYWRDQGKSRFQPEVELFKLYHEAVSPPEAKLLLYFGHEIPEYGGAGYDASSPDRVFTIEDLAGGLKQITGDSVKYDLIVLSTCFNGTPHTVSALAPYVRYIIASPENLHRSYLDLLSLERLEDGQPEENMAAFAKNYAQISFDRLTEELQTTVAIAVYDVERVQRYLNSADSSYKNALTALTGMKRSSFEHQDCAEDSAYVRPEMSEGVEVFYRSPRFGRSKNKLTHSGWGCWKQPAGKDHNIEP
jgi:hypothetical protein